MCDLARWILAKFEPNIRERSEAWATSGKISDDQIQKTHFVKREI